MPSVSSLAIITGAVDIAYHVAFGLSLTPKGLILRYLMLFAVALILKLFYQIFLFRRYGSPFRDLPAVPNPHWLWGTFIEYQDHRYDQGLRMSREYPGLPFSRFYGPFGTDQLLPGTIEAHRQILQTKCYKFKKPTTVSRGFKQFIGDGLFFSEGDQHKMQRRLLNPGFAPTYIKTLVPAFMTHMRKLTANYDEKTAAGPAIFPQLHLLSRFTLDVIGQVSFGVNLHALDDETNELVQAYTTLSTPIDDPAFFFLNSLIPGFKYLPTRQNKRMAEAKKVFKKAIRGVISQRIEDAYERKIEGKERDSLRLLLLDTEHRWTVDEIENQLMTLLLAGHETTGGALSWALLNLARNQDVQDRLRAEVQAAFPGGMDDISDETQLESLKFLNNVLRETLRINPPVPVTVREAEEDIEIEGQLIPKGTTVNICIDALNKLPEIWGADSDAFNPDRWDTDAAQNSAYGLATFIHGARACLGRRLAELEMKCTLATLVGRYKFEEAVENQVVPMDFVITLKPSDGLPLKVTRLT
ncbi:cytochrome P450 [Myxozyma melibiosi]|uniref:Cytochrome P450 n=1 Tax=Myxozyma melibiosi TaxID=54550 RepID=A0ABR1F947_9ASCO